MKCPLIKVAERAGRVKEIGLLHASGSATLFAGSATLFVRRVASDRRWMWPKRYHQKRSAECDGQHRSFKG